MSPPKKKLKPPPKKKLKPPPKKKLKPPPKKKPRKRGKRPRPIESAPEPANASIVPVGAKSNKNVRLLAKIDYVTDPEGRSIAFHYERPDREYSSLVSLERFKSWAATDSWAVDRERYFDEIEKRIIASRLDRVVEQRWKEIDELEEDLKYMREWTTPLRDQRGYVRRYPLYHTVGDPKKGTVRTELHPYGGLPIYPLKFKSMEGAISSRLKEHERAMLLRGDVTSRSESTAIDASNRPTAMDTQKLLTTVTAEERREMARALLLSRQPELKEQDTIDVDRMIEEGAKDDGNTI